MDRGHQPPGWVAGWSLARRHLGDTPARAHYLPCPGPAPAGHCGSVRRRAHRRCPGGLAAVHSGCGRASRRIRHRRSRRNHGVAGGELLNPTIVLLYGADTKLAGSLSLLVSLPTMLVAFFRYSKDQAFTICANTLALSVARWPGRSSVRWCSVSSRTLCWCPSSLRCCSYLRRKCGGIGRRKPHDEDISNQNANHRHRPMTTPASAPARLGGHHAVCRSQPGWRVGPHLQQLSAGVVEELQGGLIHADGHPATAEELRRKQDPHRVNDGGRPESAAGRAVCC